MNGLLKQYLRNSAWQNGVSPCFACASSNTWAGVSRGWLHSSAQYGHLVRSILIFQRAGPFAAILFVIALLAIVICLRRKLLKLGILFGACALVAAWWLTLKPSNDRAWQPDVAQTAWAEINGDEVTIHNVRNCDYRTATDFTTHYETRTVRLSQITGMDLAINYWGSPWIAHPIVSFQFADGPPLCFSIETRKTIGQRVFHRGRFLSAVHAHLRCGG